MKIWHIRETIYSEMKEYKCNIAQDAQKICIITTS